MPIDLNRYKYLLFLDVVESTRASKVDPGGLGQLMKEFLSNLADLSRENSGLPVQFTGDGYLCLFEGLDGALKTGVAVIQALQGATNPGSGLPAQVRVAIHYDSNLDPAAQNIRTPKEGEDWDDYLANIPKVVRFIEGYSSVAFCSRLLNVSNPNQILVSAAAHERRTTYHLPFGWKDDHPYVLLKSFTEHPEKVYEYLYPGAPQTRPGSLYYPDWYDSDVNRYVSRPKLEREIREYLGKERQTGDAPIVWIWGDGGAGKTRLAVESFLRVVGFFDRTFFASFSDLWPRIIEGGPQISSLTSSQTNVETFCKKISQSLGVAQEFKERLMQGKKHEDALIDLVQVVSVRYPLSTLFLDNFETIGCEEVLKLLIKFAKKVRKWKIIVTSRSWPGLLSGAYEIEINNGLEFEEAEALLKERWPVKDEISEWDPFVVRDLLVKKCDLLPMPIELVAAAKLQRYHYSLSEINDELSNSSKWLDAGPIVMPNDLEEGNRHHAMHLTLRYSFALLDDQAKVDYASCGLFTEKFSDTSLRAVLGCKKDSRRPQILWETSRLFKSGRASSPVYRLHASSRQFAYERFEEMSDDTKNEILNRFDNHFIELFSNHQPIFGGIETSQILNDELHMAIDDWLSAIKRKTEKGVALDSILKDLGLRNLYFKFASTGSQSSLENLMKQESFKFMFKFVKQDDGTGRFWR